MMLHSSNNYVIPYYGVAITSAIGPVLLLLVYSSLYKIVLHSYLQLCTCMVMEQPTPLAQLSVDNVVMMHFAECRPRSWPNEHNFQPHKELQNNSHLLFEYSIPKIKRTVCRNEIQSVHVGEYFEIYPKV